MATTSELTDTSLNIAGTTTINGIESTLSNNSSKVATSSAILTAINNSASNVSSYVDSAISNIMPRITITADNLTSFVSQVVRTYLDSGKRKISVIAEWPNNDFYTFEMTILDSAHSYGTICNIFNAMGYKNYNFSYNAGNLYLYNLLSTDSNSNGNYMILNDNVLICWGTVSYQITEWTQWSYCFEASPGTTITFPRTFKSVPHVFFSATTTTNACIGVEFGLTDTTHIVNCYALRPATGSIPSVAYIDWLAIGEPS